MTKLLQPIWFRLPKRFYSRLDILAESTGLAPEEVLETAVDLLGRYVVAAQHNNIESGDFIARIWALLRKQQRSADAHQVNVVEALEDALKLYRIYGPVSTSVPSHGDVSPARSAPSALGILYWAKIPPEERSRRARELARKRWDAKKADLPKAVGEDSQGQR
jgi:hypothetical protein